VGIYVSKKWRGLGRFTALLIDQMPKEFDHIANHPNEGFLVDYPIWKYMPYADFVRGAIGFDLSAFLLALTKAAKSMVTMEKRIDQVLVRMRER